MKPWLACVLLVVLSGCKSHPADTATTPSPKGALTLHQAVAQKDVQAVGSLLKSGADANAKDSEGHTPFQVAVDKGAGPEIETLLLDNGAKLNDLATLEWGPLHDAIGRQNAALVALLLEHGAKADLIEDGKPLIYTAAGSGTPEIVRLLIKHGADPNARTKDGNVALYAAAGQGVSMCMALVEGGADVNAKNKQGRTVLAEMRTWKKESYIPAETWASWSKLHAEVAAYLRSKGAR